MVRSSATLGGAMNSLGGVTKISFMGEEMRRPLRGENCLDAKTVFCTWSKTIGRSARRYTHHYRLFYGSRCDCPVHRCQRPLSGQRQSHCLNLRESRGGEVGLVGGKPIRRVSKRAPDEAEDRRHPRCLRPVRHRTATAARQR